jgi:hypothetical protein
MKKECEIFGCKKPVYRVYQIAPATTIELCKEHYDEESTGGGYRV